MDAVNVTASELLAIIGEQAVENRLLHARVQQLENELAAKQIGESLTTATETAKGPNHKSL